MFQLAPSSILRGKEGGLTIGPLASALTLRTHGYAPLFSPVSVVSGMPHSPAFLRNVALREIYPSAHLLVGICCVSSRLGRAVELE